MSGRVRVSLIVILVVCAAALLAGSSARRRAAESKIVRDALAASSAKASARSPIRHVVVVLKENRSFDQYFGRFPGADGATFGTMSDGEVVPLRQTPEPLPHDIGHAPRDFALAYDNGAMDGFDRELGAAPIDGSSLAYTQMAESQIPNYWAYARRYGLGDRMFASWKGASFSNNLFEVAAQAGEFDASIGNRSVFGLPASPSQPPLRAWGCDDPLDTLVTMVAPDGTKSSMYPCFGFEALPNVLARNSLSWKYYASPDRTAFLHNALDALARVRFVPALWSNVKNASQFFADAAAGQLPAVSWYLGVNTEHPPRTACDGENESVDVVNAIAASPLWQSTAILIVWDEWGGFYDHVPPPQVDQISYGIRVPLIVIAPYTKRGPGSDGGYVSHVLYSHASLLKFVETNWGLPSLTPKDAGANDMFDFFDFNQPPRPPLVLQRRDCPHLTPAEQRLLAREDPD